MRISRVLALGRWIVLVTSAWLCLGVLLFVLLMAYEAVTGKHAILLHEPWESVGFYLILIPHISVLLCWGLFSFCLMVLLRRRLRAGSLRQLAVLFGVVVPVWGIRYYDRVAKRLIDAPPSPPPL